MDTTVKIFLASSDELRQDRLELGDFINKINTIYRRHGMYIELLKWENFDAAYSTMRKQEEYNLKVTSSDMFLCLFYTKAGQYTVEEFLCAYESYQKTGKPKMFSYFKALPAGVQEEPSLTAFKAELKSKWAQEYSKYSGCDMLKLSLIMQLKAIGFGELFNIDFNKRVVELDGHPILNLSGIACDETYAHTSL